MHRGTRAFNVRRIAATSASLSMATVVLVWATVWTSTSAPIANEGPMSDKVLEALNDGVPAAVVRRRARIREALQSTQTADWAGEYFEGDGLGVNVSLTLAPGAGIAATWFGCTGLYASNEGEVEEQADGTLAFHFDRPNTWGGPIQTTSFPTWVRLVRWGERRYLLADEDMIAFVNAMHQGWEPASDRHGFFLMADGDAEKPAPGLPGLPAEFLRYVRSTPLEVRPISIENVAGSEDGAVEGCRFRVHFDVPDDARLAEGFEFRVTFPEDVYEVFKVVGVSGVHVSADGDYQRDCLTSRSRPSSDWVLSSGSFTFASSSNATAGSGWGSEPAWVPAGFGGNR